MKDFLIPLLILVLAVVSGLAFSQRESYADSVGTSFADEVADRMMQLSPIKFPTTASEGGQIYGFNTSDAQSKMPEIVYSDTKGLQRLNYGDMVPVIVRQLQRTEQTMSDIKKSMDQLENKVKTDIDNMYSLYTSLSTKVEQNMSSAFFKRSQEPEEPEQPSKGLFKRLLNR